MFYLLLKWIINWKINKFTSQTGKLKFNIAFQEASFFLSNSELKIFLLLVFPLVLYHHIIHRNSNEITKHLQTLIVTIVEGSSRWIKTFIKCKDPRRFIVNLLNPHISGNETSIKALLLEKTIQWQNGAVFGPWRLK